MIRDATLNDASRILEIYAYYVENTAITFEYDVPSLEEFKQRMVHTMSKYPYLVIEEDHKIVGYAYASDFHPRFAYRFCTELTVYLDNNCKGKGYGRKIYEALEDKVKKMGYTNLYACIGYPEVEDEYLNYNSALFHEHLGFKQIGLFTNCGYKFNRWYHMIWMEKIIGEHQTNQKELINYHDL